MIFNYAILSIILLASMIVSVRAGKLNTIAALTGGLTGLLIFLGAGFTGIIMIGAFFILGTGATAWKISAKLKSGVAEANKGQRTAGQVLANAGVAAILGWMAWRYPVHAELLRVMMSASLAAATADTLSSELGNVYGRKYINILTFEKDQRGLNGVISMEGTLCGIAGSAVIALIYAVGFGWNENFAWIILAGTAGNVADSILGATLERRKLMGNNVVNFLNTLFAAFVALMLV